MWRLRALTSTAGLLSMIEVSEGSLLVPWDKRNEEEEDPVVVEKIAP